MSRHSALCHNSGVRHRVANKAGCAHDKGALSPTTEPGAHNKHGGQLGCTHERVACTARELCRDREFSVVTDLDRFGHNRVGLAQQACSWNRDARTSMRA